MNPVELMRASFDAAVAAADPLRVVAAHLPEQPTGRVVVVGAGKVRWISRTVPARQHDKALAEREKLRLPRGVSLLGDSGFAGLDAGEADLITPWKKPPGRRLHWKRRKFNRLLSGERIQVEHTFASIKRLRILREEFRNRRTGMVDAVMEFGCTLHNYRWSNRQQTAA